MIGKSLLAATLASGLLLPPPPGLYVPAKPAIVKPENLHLSSHLLAMPLTVGAIKGQSGPPATLSYVTMYRSNFPGLQNTGASSVPVGAPGPDRTIIVIVSGIATTNVANSVTSLSLSSVAMTKQFELNVGNFACAVFTIRNDTSTQRTVSVSFSTSQAGLTWSIYSAYGLQSIVPTDTSAAWGANSLPASGLNVQRGGIVIGEVMTNRTDGAFAWTGLTANHLLSATSTLRAGTASQTFAQAQVNLPLNVAVTTAGTFSTAIYAAFR